VLQMLIFAAGCGHRQIPGPRDLPGNTLLVRLSPVSLISQSLSLLFFYHLVPVCYLSVCVCVKGMMDVSFMTELNVVWANLSWDYEDPAGVL